MPQSTSTLHGDQSLQKNEKDSMKESIKEDLKSAQSKGSKTNIRGDTGTLDKSGAPGEPTSTLPESTGYPEPCEEMLTYAHSIEGFVELKDLYYKCQPDFKAGNY